MPLSNKRKLLKAALAGSVLGTLPFPARADVLTIGHVSLSFYEVTAHVVGLMVERMGINAAFEAGSHSQIFPRVGAGSVDLLVAAWLPYAHADYWKEYKKDLVQVSTLYENARLFWAVPAYVPAEAVKSVADLTKPEVAERMVKTIRSTLPDSGLSIGSKKIFDHYGLAGAGYQFEPGPAKDWLANINTRMAANEWFVMPLWQPQFLNRAHKLRILDEPEKFLGEANRAVLVANKDSFARLDKRHKAVLSRIELSLKSVTELDYWVNVEKMGPREAARRWLGTNQNTVTYWLSGPDED